MTLSATLRLFALMTVSAMLFCTDANAQDDIRLIYNINTGNVQVEIINPMIELFSIETLGPDGSEGNGFLLFNNVDSSTAVGAPIDTPPANQDTIAFLDTSNPFPVTTVNLGNIMPPGITFVSLDASDEISIGTDSAGNTGGFGALAYTVSGSPGELGFSTSTTITTVATMAVCGDINLDGGVNFLDIAPFIEILTSNGFQAEADCDLNGVVNFLDIAPFIQALSGN